MRRLRGGEGGVKVVKYAVFDQVAGNNERRVREKGGSDWNCMATGIRCFRENCNVEDLAPGSLQR